jgi:hypothetical protein
MWGPFIIYIYIYTYINSTNLYRALAHFFFVQPFLAAESPEGDNDIFINYNQKMATTAVAHRGRTAFRRLLKSAKYAFKSDIVAYNAARSQLREEFWKYKGETDPEALQVPSYKTVEGLHFTIFLNQLLPYSRYLLASMKLKRY